MKIVKKISQSGTAMIVISLLLWGIMPIYFKLIQIVSPFEILAHRIIWSFVFLFIILSFKKQLSNVIKIFYMPKFMLTLTTTALLIACNWIVFIWAIISEHLVEASFGYFISPIFNIFLGLIFLKEKLNFIQIVSLTIAIISIIIQITEIKTIGFTTFIPLLLAASLGFYVLLRKGMPIDSIHGLTIETALLSPLAIIYLFYLTHTNQLMFFNSINLMVLLSFAGIITSAPLILYIAGAKYLPLYKIGFLQYISPIVQLLIAVYIFKESISYNKLTSFCLIWIALFIYLFNNFLEKNKKISEKNLN